MDNECVEDNSSNGSSLQQKSPRDIEKVEEDKLKAKYKTSSGWPISGHSVFLQKKLAKGQKFFDSGDYQMAKQSSVLNKSNKETTSPPVLNFGTGGEIPTPDTIPARKTSIIQPKYTPTA